MIFYKHVPWQTFVPPSFYRIKAIEPISWWLSPPLDNRKESIVKKNDNRIELPAYFFDFEGIEAFFMQKYDAHQNLQKKNWTIPFFY